MIKLHRLDGKELWVKQNSIYMIEPAGEHAWINQEYAVMETYKQVLGLIAAE